MTDQTSRPETAGTTGSPAAKQLIQISDVVEMRKLSFPPRQVERIVSAEEHKLTVREIFARPVNHKDLFPSAKLVRLRESKWKLSQ